MTPDQEKMIRATAGGRFLSGAAITPVPEIAALAQVVLELVAKADHPLHVRRWDDLSVVEKNAIGRAANALRPLRERLEQYLAEYHYSQPKGYFSETQIVDGLLAILEEGPIPEPRLVHGCLVGPEFVRDQFKQAVQAIRRGE